MTGMIESRLQYTRNGMAFYIIESDGESYALKIEEARAEQVDKIAEELIARFNKGELSDELEFLG